ncbi:MAG: GNAT family N-acetyltransferase [Rhodospirillales bacterium]|nr:GNAT family N-acetyltransferase [Acetobacter sp.]
MDRSDVITLRNVEDSDLPTFFEQQLDPEANRMAAFVNASRQERTAFDAHWKRILNSPGIVNKTILRGDQIAGQIACYPQEGELEVTYWLGREYWGQGIATQALQELLREISHRPVFARAAKDNHGSVKVLEKCGFKVIGEDSGFAQGRGEETEEYIFRLDGEHP